MARPPLLSQAFAKEGNFLAQTSWQMSKLQRGVYEGVNEFGDKGSDPRECCWIHGLLSEGLPPCPQIRSHLHRPRLQSHPGVLPFSDPINHGADSDQARIGSKKLHDS